MSLFSAIFLFVNRFPTPPAQGTSQFQTTLIYSSTGAWIKGIKILHVGGPAVSSTGRIYLRLIGGSTSDAQFQAPGNAPIGACLNVSTTPSVYSSASWLAGETWYSAFSPNSSSTPTGCHSTSTNISTTAASLTVDVYIIVGSTVLYNVAIPVSTSNAPPVIMQVWTNTTTLVHNSTSFWLYATVLNINGVTGKVVALTGAIPGMNSTLTFTYLGTSATPHLWGVHVGGTYSAKKAGTYTGFVQASDIVTNQSSSATFTITFS